MRLKDRWRYLTEYRPEPPQLPPWGYKEPTFKDKLEDLYMPFLGLGALLCIIAMPILWAFGLLGALRGIVQFVLH